VGERWRWDDTAQFTLLNGSGQEQTDRNTGSCVLRVDIGRQRFLLSGDIPRRREQALVRYWGRALRAQVLLLAHHGSGTSSGHTWLKWVAPTVAVATDARANRFGHPHPDVIERLQLWGIPLLQTSRDGALRWRPGPLGEWHRDAARGPWTPYWLRLP
jgi:competence protein ComEC